ncbi:MAG: hypothetical protein LQ350_007648 [Teloschistes chrysophthalmus]|nr:MAG: hypothetical protein LQ350_007648 [Niorma chrysophthalma]
MRFLTLTLSILPTIAQSANIVLSNDDGWAEINIRAFYDKLTRAGNSVILSAPADNKSGTGSSDAPALPLTKPCEFNSCPTGSPAEGSDASNPRLNYVNSYPVTSMRYGIQTLSPKYFGGAPDLAVAGFNVGANLGTTTLISGTVGAATSAAKTGIPALAFSGSTGSQIPYTTLPTPAYVTTYTTLSANITNTLLLASTSKPYLPQNVWLNINYPPSTSTSCTKPEDFGFVLSRINAATSATPADVRTCGKTRLPTESAVVGTRGGCWASVSVGDAGTKGDATAAEQAVVLGKLAGVLSCLPGSS